MSRVIYTVLAYQMNEHMYVKVSYQTVKEESCQDHVFYSINTLNETTCVNVEANII